MRYTLYSENDFCLRRRFLALPEGLYPPERRTQDRAELTALLCGEHPLSADLAVYPFLALDENDQSAARCMLALCPGDENGYVGFFESEDAPDAAALVLGAAAEKAKLFGRSRLVGPCSASFWLGSRFKISNFREYYTGEPNNMAYYPRLWEACGFRVTDRYVSHHMRVPTDADVREEAVRRLEAARAAGYDFRTITLRTFDDSLRDICALLTRLYSDLPGFQEITERQFVTLFSPLRYVLDHEMVKLVYYHGALAACAVCIPNYGALAARDRSLRDTAALLRMRRAPGEYVIPYMGVAPEHAGLGSALTELLRQELQRKNAKSVTAPIRDGEVPGDLCRVLKTHETAYVLMAKEWI
ncbi:MAG: hypothetical protein IJ112_05215 [Oscillospiraceae bacterium]|nr:hypothetical protein [Oscillospiraceae bacterium]